MKVQTIACYFLAIIALGTALNLVQVAKILAVKDQEYYRKKILEIPEKITSKIKDMNKKTHLTTAYTFPSEYKTTIFKDYAKETTLVNVFPRIETSTQTIEYQTLDFQSLEPSTTFVMKILNSTVQFQETPMLNSSLHYPNTVPMQSIGYATVEFQHEILIHPTRIEVSEYTSTTTVNFTHIEEVDNSIPLI